MSGFRTAANASRMPMPGLLSLLLAFLVVACGLAACAKKMLPPSPDRFAPRLEEVKTRNRVRIELVFDEDIDAAKLSPDSFAVSGPAEQGLAVRGVVAGRKENTVVLWTMPQEPALYRVRGAVADLAGNVGRFSARFRGSDRADTVAPRATRITPAPGSAGNRMTIRVDFSEPLDTAQGVPYFFVPSSWDSMFGLTWEKDWQAVVLGSARQDRGYGRQGANQKSEIRNQKPEIRNPESPESLGPVGIVYFLLLPGVRDLEGNRSREPAFTYFTPDSALEASAVHGRAAWQHGPLGTGVVFFNAEKNPGLAPILTDSSFSVKLAPGDYEVQAVADTNADRVVDLASSVVKFNTLQESLELPLLPESLPRPIEDYRRR